MAPAFKLVSVVALLATSVFASPHEERGGVNNAPFVGWGQATVGGSQASKKNTYTVTNFNEFKTALNNQGSPNSPKIIYVEGVVSGNTLASGEEATAEYYARNTNYTWDLYLQSFNQTYRDELTAAGDTATLALLDSQESGRYQASLEQKQQITVLIPAYTSIIGKYSYSTRAAAKFQGVALAVNWTEQVILQNFEVEAPIDLFPEWDPTDSSTGNWNAGYDAIGIVTSTNVVADHLAINDGAHPDDDEPIVFGKVIQRHDGAIDITEGADLITVSYCNISNHDKSHLVGNNDLNNLGPGDVGKLRVTFYGNLFQDSLQRNPRVRFGQVHVLNNYYEASISKDLVYYIGMGINSTILSEANSFVVRDATTVTQALNYVVGNYKGYNLKDVGSLVNGVANAGIEAVAATKYNTTAQAELKAAATAGRDPAEWATHTYTNAGFVPPYKYSVKKAKDVKQWVSKNVGPQK